MRAHAPPARRTPVTAVLLLAVLAAASFAVVSGALPLIHAPTAQAASCTWSGTGVKDGSESPCEGSVGTVIALNINLAAGCPGGVAPSSYVWQVPLKSFPMTSKGLGTVTVPAGALPGRHVITANCVGNANVPGPVDLFFTVDPPTISPSPSSGLVGSAFKIRSYGWPSCGPISYYFVEGTTPHLLATVAAAPANGGGPTVTVPAGSVAGTHQLEASCKGAAATSTYTVLRPRPTPTPTHSTSATPSASSTPTPTPTVSVSTPPPSVTPSPATTGSTDLTLTSFAIPPGAQDSAFGHGCPAGSTVTLSIAGTTVGQTQAASDGSFQSPLDVGSLAVGRYQVDAACGPILSAPLDIVLASQVSADTSTLAVIVFFLMLGVFVYRRRLMPPPRRSPERT